MSEHDILDLINQDEWMMFILKEAEKLQLSDWMVGAGFVRNKVWDYLHGYQNKKVPTSDIDLIYFDSGNPHETKDTELSNRMKEKTGINWEIINQAYTHKWHNRKPYRDTEDALSDWVETPTCVAVSLNNGVLKLHAPFGIEDLVNLVVRKNERCSDSASYQERVASKKWKEKWPRLEILGVSSK